MRNRWSQLTAAVVAMLMIANLQYAWTLFVDPIQQATGWHLPAIQWAFSLFVLLQTWVQPLDGWLIDRLGHTLATVDRVVGVWRRLFLGASLDAVKELPLSWPEREAAEARIEAVRRAQYQLVEQLPGEAAP